jgi:hypothetical protein
MPGSMSDYLENKILEHALGKTPYAMPTLYAALYTATPTEAGGVNELAGAGYARIQATFGSATNGSISNAQNITFPQATANWGNVVAVGLVDAVTGGNLLWYGNLDVAKLISSGDQFVIPTGSLVVTLD